MKKLLLLTLVGLFVAANITNAFAAFPVKTEKSKTEQKSNKVLKKEIKTSNEASNYEESAAAPEGGGGKSQVLAAVLAFFLGGLGIHNFYLGNSKKGIIQLVGTLLGIVLMIAGFASLATGSTGIPLLAILGYLLLVGVGIWAFVDFIRILIGGYPGL